MPKDEKPDYEEKRNELLGHFLTLYSNNPLQAELWRNRAGKPLNEVCDRLVAFHLNQILSVDENVSETYSSELVSAMKNGIAQLLLIGFFLYYLDRKEMQGKPVTKHDEPALKPYLMEVVGVLEEGEDNTRFDPPRYAFEACKESFWYWLKGQSKLPDEQNFIKQLGSDNHRQFYLTKAPWLVCEGFILSSAQDTFKAGVK